MGPLRLIVPFIFYTGYVLLRNTTTCMENDQNNNISDMPIFCLIITGERLQMYG